MKNYCLTYFESFTDKRGCLIKPFDKENFKKLDLKTTFSECLYTKSIQNVIRGMHHQNCVKFIWVSYGTILDVLLNVDSTSSYGEIASNILSDKTSFGLYVGKEYAHGFKVLSDFAIVNYLIEFPFNSLNDKGYRWDSFGFNWDIQNPIISQKDLSLPEFKK